MGCCDAAPNVLNGGDCNYGPCAKFYVPLLPCPPDICPPGSCPAEAPCDLCQFSDIPCNLTWWRDRKPDTSKYVHDDCWCNGWNSKIKKPVPIPPATIRQQSLVDRMSWRERAEYEKELRQMLYPPPPANICNFKPCTMEMQPPTWCNPTWTGLAQKCAKEPKTSYYMPGPCRRPGCLHVETVKGSRCSGGMCKAHCYDPNCGIKRSNRRCTIR